MKKVIRLTESDLTRIVKRVIRESQTPQECISCIMQAGQSAGIPQLTQDKAQSILNILSKGQPPTPEDMKSILNLTDFFKLAQFGMGLMGCQTKCMPTGQPGI
jgi:hypothetical protein